VDRIDLGDKRGVGRVEQRRRECVEILGGDWRAPTTTTPPRAAARPPSEDVALA
jgi:hypothetical protein